MSAYSIQNTNRNKTWILIFVFVGLVSLLFYLAGVAINSPYLAFIGLFISLAQALGGYFFGDKIALMSAGGRQVEYKQAPTIHEIVTNLSKIAGIPKPKIYISPDKSANAFACGRNPKNASICLNQGLLELLNKHELEGVIAHELAHIKNRDILLMTVTMVLASLVSFITDIGFRSLFFRRQSDSDSKSPVIIILYIVAMLLAPILATLIQLSISRKREYLADATAIVFTRYPEGLISALNKLYQSPVPSSHYSTATNHFYISPPKKKFGEKISGLFSTHPSIEERVAALKNM